MCNLPIYVVSLVERDQSVLEIGGMWTDKQMISSKLDPCFDIHNAYSYA